MFGLFDALIGLFEALFGVLNVFFGLCLTLHLGYAGMSKGSASTLSLAACQYAGSALTCWEQPPGTLRETGRMRAGVTSIAASVLVQPLVGPAPSCTAANLDATGASALGKGCKPHLLCSYVRSRIQGPGVGGWVGWGGV